MKRLELKAFETLEKPFSVYVFYEVKKKIADFKFQLFGDLSQIEFPENYSDSFFEKELWKSTCAEIFVKNADNGRYFEWNFGLNSRWWSGEFSEYRKFFKERKDLQPLSQEKYISKKRDELVFMLKLDLSNLEIDSNLFFHPCLILKTKKGPKIHWALQHFSDQPDFHQADNFKKLLLL